VTLVAAWYFRRQSAEIASPSSALKQARRRQRWTNITSPLPADLLAELRTPGNFQMRHRVADIPAAVRAAFANATHLDAFSMAEPGAMWQATDVVITPPLPWRGLRAVAVSNSSCVLFYEGGGIGKSNNAAVFRFSAGGVQAVGHAFLDAGVADLARLRIRAEGKQEFLDLSFF